MNGSPLFDKDIYALRDWIHNNPISVMDNQRPVKKYEMIADNILNDASVAGYKIISKQVLKEKNGWRTMVLLEFKNS